MIEMEIMNNDNVKEVQKLSEKEIKEKEELERLYVNEGKSIAEIKNIYGCSWYIIEKKLNKYEISIRSCGSFLVDDDGETFSSKRYRNEISQDDYYNKLAESKGCKNWNEYCNELNYESGRVKSKHKDSLHNKYLHGEVTYSDWINHVAVRKGYENRRERLNEWAKNKGYDNYNDYLRFMSHKSGKYLPMSENKNCTLYLGVHIAENVLSKVFKNVDRYSSNNKGFDFICGKNYKIDVKSSCIRNGNFWTFIINKNKVADYFLLIAFDNREELNPLHIWLIKSNEFIKKNKISEKYSVSIMNINKSIDNFKQYELIDKLKDVQKVCDEFKKNEVR